MFLAQFVDQLVRAYRMSDGKAESTGDLALQPLGHCLIGMIYASTSEDWAASSGTGCPRFFKTNGHHWIASISSRPNTLLDARKRSRS